MKTRLTHSERMILERLAKARDYVTTDQLIQAVWPRDEPDAALQTLRSHMFRLRKKIHFTGLSIQSQPYFGYRLID